MRRLTSDSNVMQPHSTLIQPDVPGLNFFAPNVMKIACKSHSQPLGGWENTLVMISLEQALQPPKCCVQS